MGKIDTIALINEARQVYSDIYNNILDIPQVLSYTRYSECVKKRSIASHDQKWKGSDIHTKAGVYKNAYNDLYYKLMGLNLKSQIEDSASNSCALSEFLSCVKLYDGHEAFFTKLESLCTNLTNLSQTVDSLILECMNYRTSNSIIKALHEKVESDLSEHADYLSNALNSINLEFDKLSEEDKEKYNENVYVFWESTNKHYIGSGYTPSNKNEVISDIDNALSKVS